MVSGRRDRDPPRDGLSTQDGGALVADGRCGGMVVDEAAGGARLKQCFSIGGMAW